MTDQITSFDLRESNPYLRLGLIFIIVAIVIFAAEVIFEADIIDSSLYILPSLVFVAGIILCLIKKSGLHINTSCGSPDETLISGKATVLKELFDDLEKNLSDGSTSLEDPQIQNTVHTSNE
jgi:hypothetical protein